MAPFSKPGFPNICRVPPPVEVIVSVTLVERVWVPSVALMTKVYVPVGVPGPVASVSVVAPSPGAGIVWGTNVGFTAAGRPVADKLSDELKPFEIDVFIATVGLSPWTAVMDVVDALSENVGPKAMSMIGCNSMPFGAMPS